MPEEEVGLDEAIRTIRSWIRDAERVVVLTGAGISTDSGIPDFRGPKGVWTLNPGAERRATLQNWMSDPEVRKRRWQSQVSSTSGPSRQPNEGHRALVALEQRGKLDTLITQNVDGLHIAAGTTPERVVEIHGTTRDYVCMACGERGPMEKLLERVRAGEEDPECRSCGGILKSATISFGQSLVAEDLMRSEVAAQSCDLMMAVGSTLSVVPICNVVPVAKHAGAKIVILNGEPTEMDGLADALIRGSISEVLPRICAADG
jgi:NAD-dependent deacetylase